MCGIWASLEQVPNRVELLQRLEARGPECTRLLDLSGCSLGFTRLAINGLTEAGDQPFAHEGSFVVCNGEIYNYKELAERWGIQLTEGASDCEVLLHLLRKLPLEEVCRTLDGVFAFVAVIGNKLMVARDPLNVRPLFQSGLTWASELKALPPSSFSSAAPFPPGTCRSYSIDTHMLLNSCRYYTIPRTTLPALEHRDMARHALHMALTAAVRKRMLSDRPIGALLSGGLDSSLVCAIAAKELKQAGKKLHTFSIGMPGSTDLVYAQRVADYIGSEHHNIVVSPDDFLRAIPQVIQDIESYDITTVRASVGNWLVGKYIREHTDIKVVLNGDGSDEVGGGYLYLYAAPSNEEFDAECARLLESIHMFDVLRSDRSMAAHGLEARTPFLDKAVVATWLSIPARLRRPAKPHMMEKQILREAFDQCLLPFDVLWRKKEAFSDGVSSTADSWYLRCSQSHQTQTQEEEKEKEYAHNPPQTAEAVWYRRLFEESYPQAAAVIPYMWMPRWVQTKDPSARTLKELY